MQTWSLYKSELLSLPGRWLTEVIKKNSADLNLTWKHHPPKSSKDDCQHTEGYFLQPRVTNLSDNIQVCLASPISLKLLLWQPFFSLRFRSIHLHVHVRTQPTTRAYSRHSQQLSLLKARSHIKHINYCCRVYESSSSILWEHVIQCSNFLKIFIYLLICLFVCACIYAFLLPSIRRGARKDITRR